MIVTFKGVNTKVNRDTATHYELMSRLEEIDNQLHKLAVDMRKAIYTEDKDKLLTIVRKLEEIY